MPCRAVVPAVVALMLFAPASLDAQARDTFVQGVVALTNAVHGAEGGEGPAILSALDTMAAGLAQWDAAVSGVERGLAAEVGAAPPNVAARMRTALGAAYLERGRLDAALAQFDTAVKLDPSFVELHGLRALAYDMAGRSDAAADAYRTLWQQAPGRPADAYRFLRSRPAAAGPTERAAAVRVLSAAAESARPASTPLVSFVVMNLLDEASLSAPVFPPAAYAEAFTLLRRGQYNEGFARAREAAAADPLVSDPSLRSTEVQEAVAALKRGHVADAVARLSSAAAREGSSELHRLLGRAYAVDKQYERSLEHLRTAVRLNPRDERARLSMGDVLAAAGDLPAAREALYETTQIVPLSGQAHWELGRIHQALADERSALQSFEAAAALGPFAGAGHLDAAIGRLHHVRLDLDAAAAAYERRVRAAPNDSGAHFDLGEVYRAQDRLDEALVEFLVAALLDPAGAGAFAMAGQVHAAAGRDEEAVRMLRGAVARDAGHLEARYALGRALLRLGRTAEARDELEVFERLQAKAMEAERQRFEDNQRKIEEILKAGEPKDPAR